jgi:hypothetical protein
MPRLAYWDQEDHDKAMHLIHQPRNLSLQLAFAVGEVPLANKRVRVFVARSMVVGCDEFHDLLLDNEGKLELIQEYGESLIDVELGSQALPSGCEIDALTFHWFHPGKWFQSLKVKRDLESWGLRQLEQKEGDITFELTFDSKLTPMSASVNFGNLLGHIYEGPEMGSNPEATVTIPQKGKAHFTFHMRNFFEKWNSNYTTPFKVGDEYPLELFLTFNVPFEVKPSSQKDPEFVPKVYDGRVDHTNGDPYIGVPPTIPESTIQILCKQKIPITNEMIPD